MPIGPSYADLKPMKGPENSNLPVYPDLLDKLASESSHPDREVAYALATCAGYAYAESKGCGDARTVATMMTRMGLPGNHCQAIELTVDSMYLDTTAFMVQSHDGRVVILSYRGTEVLDLVDWLSDADLEPEIYSFSFDGVKETAGVHSGYYRGARATRHRVVKALQRALAGRSILDEDDPDRPDTPLAHSLHALYITGHSLGGAIAAMMAVMLKSDAAYERIAHTLRAVYTFGQPMLATPEFAEKCRQRDYDKDMFRYIHRRDVVPHVPPRTTGRFEHIGSEFQYKDVTPGHPDPSRDWKPNDRVTQQASLLEFSFAFLIDFPLRRFPLARKYIIGPYNRLHAVVSSGPLGSAAGTLVPWVPVLRLLRFPYIYAIEEHAPHHYISKLATEGVLNEYGGQPRPTRSPR